MLEIVKHREHKESVEYYRDFLWRKDPTGGLWFPCDKDGNLLNENPASKENYEKCLNGTFDVVDYGIKKHVNRWVEPAEAKCICGHIIYLASFTNTCEKCHRDYNMSGQLLASREQWGEETGETADDILRIGHTES